MEVRDILQRIRKSHFNISLNGSDLMIGGDSRMPDDLITEIKKNKPAIIDYLRRNLSHAIERSIPETGLSDLGYPLSSSQRRLWLMCQVEGGNSAYTMPGVYLLEGALDREALATSFDKLVERHEILRTVFKENENGEARQFVLPARECGFVLDYIDLRNIDASGRDLAGILEMGYNRPFDLGTGPMLRASLYHTDDEKYILAYAMHHIVSDGVSMAVLIRDVLAFYQAAVLGMEVSLPSLPIQYKDYSAWQQHRLDSPEMQEHRSYWLGQLAGELPVLELAGERVRPAVKSYGGGSVRRRLDARVSRELRQLCREQNATLFMGLLAAVHVLLYRYTQQGDIIIGSPIAGRGHSDLEDQIGFYVNMLALRARFDGNGTFRELLIDTRDRMIAAYAHQAYPFDRLVEEVSATRDRSRNPLFDVTVVLQNTNLQNQEPDDPKGLKIQRYSGEERVTSRFDLEFEFLEPGDEIELYLVYNSDLYDKKEMERLAAQYEQLLQSILRDADKPIAGLQMLTKEDIDQLIGYSGERDLFEEHRSAIELFLGQARRSPGAMAVICEDRRLTYADLAEKAGRLACCLRDKWGVRNGEIIGIMLDRSELVPVAILGIWMAGGAYVPMDPADPESRNSYIISDTSMRLLVTEAKYMPAHADENTALIDIQTVLRQEWPAPAAPACTGSSPAYAIYTSGSTGKPKGVLVEHKSIVRLVKSPNYLNVSGDEVLLSTAAVSFDASVFEYWIVLLNGGRLVMCGKESLLDTGLLISCIRKNNVNMMWFTSGWLNEIVDSDIHVFKGLRTLLAGGDVLSPAHIARLLDEYPEMTIVNGYGPTENTTFSLTWTVESATGRIPIGRPIGGSTAYILDGGLHLMPAGAVGEIYLGGLGLARKYLNNDELTAEKFVRHPMKEGERLYRTGDLGRWMEGGVMEFIGRRDDQIKIRGYRVETGEVEAVFQAYPGIDLAAVLLEQNAQNQRELVTYIVSKVSINVSELRSYAARQLPAYMIPRRFMRISHLPLTENGKVDRKALLPMATMELVEEKAYVAPRDPIEAELVEIWQELLDKPGIGITDDFYILGGHSLKTIRLAGKIHKQWGVKISVRQLFAHPILEQQARLIEQAGRTGYQEITPADVQENYVLSSAQQRLWYLCQLEGGNLLYIIPAVYIIEGKLDVDGLQYSFRQLVLRHEILRTVFREDGPGEVRQYVLTPEMSGFTVEYADVRDIEQERWLHEQLEREMTTPFELSSGPLLRACLYRTGEDRWVLIYTMHHIISDAWSMGVLIRELLLLYKSYKLERQNPLPPMRIQYKDYAVWQRRGLEETLSASRSFWLGQLGGVLPLLELPGDKVRSPGTALSGETIRSRIDAVVSNGIRKIMAEEGSTLFMGLLAAVGALLHRYSQQEEMIIGSPVAGREHSDLADQIGFYVNMLALRISFGADESYRQLLAKTREIVLEAFRFADHPIDKLIEELRLPRHKGRHPLFNVTVGLQNAPLAGRENDTHGLRITAAEESEVRMSEFDLSFDFTEVGEEIHLLLVYNSAMYSSEMMQQLSVHFVRLLESIISNPERPLQRLDLLSRQEREKLLRSSDNTGFLLSDKETIPGLFEAQAARTPYLPAVRSMGVELTYRELDHRANRLAHFLRDRYETGPDIPIGILLERNEWTIVVILAILKTGSAYVPIEPDLPQSRIDYILRDTRIRVLVTQTEYIFDMATFDGALVAIDVQWNTIAAPEHSCIAGVNGRNLAYIMYTSGSTGEPKGVMIEHRSVIRLVKHTNYISLTEKNTLLSTGAVSFDATTFEYWGTLLNGGCLVMVSREVLLDAEVLGELIGRNDVDTMWFTSGLFNELVDRSLPIFRRLRTILVGGDVLSVAHVNRVLSEYPGTRIINGYGPTENTTFSLTHALDSPVERIPIGRPINNSTVYILDAQQQLLPMGVRGELYVGGAGLARGYLNLDELTAERFVPHPFLNGERLYRTGDLGRWLSDHTVEFMGRMDDQVKIRGYRIELQEIEHVIVSLPDVDSAAVLAKANAGGEKQLVAYVVGREQLFLSDIRMRLSKVLPAYMLPVYYIPLKQLPLNRNGKVDRRALPDPEEMDILGETGFVGPRNALEERLIKLWEEVLDRKNISVVSDFFDLGGHSLKATRLASQIHKQFEVKVTLRELFSHTTLEDQARLIAEMGRVSFEQIPVLQTAEDYVLSSAQRRLWVLSQLEESNVAYNMTAVYLLEGHLDLSALSKSFENVIDRHEILRTVFRENERGEARQYVFAAAHSGFRIDYRDQPEIFADNAVLKKMVISESLRPFGLTQGPLLRATLYRTGERSWVFTYTMHHIISDGWSMGVLLKELISDYAFYRNGKRAYTQPLPVQYKDYAAWQQQQLQGDALRSHKQYWLGQFAGDLPVLGLWGDRPRPVMKSYRGGTVSRMVGRELTEGLKTLCRQEGATLFMGLVALVNTLVYRYTGQTDVIVGSPVAGREHADLEGQIGFYLNLLALRTKFTGDGSFVELLSTVREVTLGAYEHQIYPFDELVDNLQLRRDLSRHPLFEVMVILQNMEKANITGPEELRIKAFDPGSYVSKYDLTFDISEFDGELQCNIEYNSDIYDSTTVERMSSHLENLLQCVLGDATRSLNRLQYIGEQERDRIVHLFNETYSPSRRDATLTGLFARQAALMESKTAVLFEGRALSYRELQEWSASLGHYLRERHGIGRNDLVGIRLRRSEWLVISILGVLRSGGAYVPMDPNYPETRVTYIRADSRCKVVLDEQELEAFRQESHRYDKKDLTEVNEPGDLAYIIYTSGSTGKPKGVMVEHANVVVFLENFSRRFFFHQDMCIAATTNYIFDISLLELIGSLIYGMTLVLFSEDPANLRDAIMAHRIDILQLTPSRLASLMEEGWDYMAGAEQLRVLLVGGEPMSPTLYSRLKKLPVDVLNVYGPTETTIWSTALHLQSSESLSIGKPLLNESILILDKERQLVPLGVVGEICIGGGGVARGYLNRPELTAEKFIGHPLEPGARIYRTGDIGRWLPDGNLEFIGRIDDQVKIRGYRIEPGEIEQVLAAYPGIESVAVLACENGRKEKELTAFLMAKQALNLAMVRQYSAQFLPAYMLPDHYVQLQQFPLTPTGKVNRKILADLPADKQLRGGTDFIAPRNDTEERLTAIWRDILEKDKIGVMDNFFDLGGNSLKAIRLINLIKREFGLEMTMRDIFNRPTIENIAQGADMLSWIKSEKVEEQGTDIESLTF